MSDTLAEQFMIDVEGTRQFFRPLQDIVQALARGTLAQKALAYGTAPGSIAQYFPLLEPKTEEHDPMECG